MLVPRYPLPTLLCAGYSAVCGILIRQCRGSAKFYGNGKKEIFHVPIYKYMCKTNKQTKIYVNISYICIYNFVTPMNNLNGGIIKLLVIFCVERFI